MEYSALILLGLALIGYSYHDLYNKYVETVSKLESLEALVVEFLKLQNDLNQNQQEFNQLQIGINKLSQELIDKEKSL